MHNTRTPNREFNGFDDPLAKILLGIGILLTAMFVSLSFSMAFVGMKFLGPLISVTWLLGAYAVVGAIFGLVRSIQFGKAIRSRSA